MSNPRYNPLPTPANTLFSGYLNISKLSGWNRMAKKRWIVINLETLQFYREKDDNKLAGSVSLVDCTINDLPIENGEHRFEVINPPDSHIFSSNNAKDIEDAIKAIKKGLDQRENAVFGQRLSKVIRRQSAISPNNPIPNIVLKSANFIRSKGLDEEGLFRLPGNTNKVKELKKHFDQGTDYIIPEETDIHTVASLLKLYLRELPESLIPSDSYEICVIAIDTYDTNKFKGINQIMQVLNEIPSVNYDLIKFLMKFLNDVQEYSSMNKMDIDNLSTVFGPNMLSVNFQDPEALMRSTKILAEITKVLIRHYNDIFVISATNPASSDQARESTLSDDIYQDLEVASSHMTQAQSYNTASTEITMLEKEKSKLKGQVDKLVNQMETIKVEYEDKLKDLRKLLETEKNTTRVLQIKLKYERRARLAEEDRNAQLQIDLDRLCSNMLEE